MLFLTCSSHARNSGDRLRQAQRSASPRRVLTVTSQHRESLRSQFESWVRSLGFLWMIFWQTISSELMISTVYWLGMEGVCIQVEGRTTTLRKPPMQSLWGSLEFGICIGVGRTERPPRSNAMANYYLSHSGLVGRGRHVCFNMGCSPSRRWIFWMLQGKTFCCHPIRIFKFLCIAFRTGT